MQATADEAKKDGIKVPTTLAEYCVTAKPKPQEPADLTDFYDDDYVGDDDDEDDDFYDDDDDSGQGDMS